MHNVFPFLISTNMKTIIYMALITIVVSTALVIYGIVIDDIKNFFYGITGLVVSLPTAILIAEKLDNRRISNNKN